MQPIKTTKQALRRFLLEKQGLYPSAHLQSGAALNDQEETLTHHEKKLQKKDAASESERSVQQILAMVRQLECVQIDPVSAVSPNQHLVLSARIPGYHPSGLNLLLEQNRIFEYMANALCLIPMEDYPLFEPTRRRIRELLQSRIQELGPVVQEVLTELEKKGPLMTKAFQTDQIVHGYWDNQQAKTKATTHALNLLTDSGQIRVVKREGTQRYFDLTERSIPESVASKAAGITEEEAAQLLIQKYQRAYRVFEPSDARFGWQRLKAAERRQAIQSQILAGLIVPVQIKDVSKEYYILQEDVERLRFYEDISSVSDRLENETQHFYFLPPLDNLLWSRQRLVDLFDFEYKWEIYIPAAKRKYGYYTMPILYGDRLVGRLDPRLDRQKQHLQINLLQLEEGAPQDSEFLGHLTQAIASFARTHGAATFSIEGG